MKKTRTKVKPLEHTCKDCLFLLEVKNGIESCVALDENFHKQSTKEINTCSNWQN